jgi:hypothetical protein
MVRVWVNRAILAKPSHEQRTSDGPARIVVTPDHKTRYWADGRSDEWPTLYRRDMVLSDEDWYASPGEGWEEQ